jgi:hypothetical protein
MLDDAACTRLGDLIAQRHQQHLRDETCAVTCERHLDNVRIGLSLTTRDGRSRYVLEMTAAEGDGITEKLVDCLDAWLTDWFAGDREIRLGHRFEVMTFGDLEVGLRGRRRNLFAEQQAADLLGEPLEPDFLD